MSFPQNTAREANTHGEGYLYIKAPATTANIGSGFDSIGMAFKLYNNLWLKVNEASKDRITVQTVGGSVSNDENHLIYKTIETFYNETGVIKGVPDEVPNLLLIQEDYIPRTRGLGSSAACIVSGVVAANALRGTKLSVEELAYIAAKIETHPDNSTPCLVGGAVVGVLTDSHLDYIKLDSTHLTKLKYYVMTPSFELSTESARNVLPSTYSKKDAIYNLSRSALLVAALTCGDFSKLYTATGDKIHQDYRMHMVPNMDVIFKKSVELGGYCAFLSGAGPTIIALADSHDFGEKMNLFLATLSNDWILSILEPDLEGTTIGGILC